MSKTNAVAYDREIPDILTALGAVQSTVDGDGIDPILTYLVKLRASQINRCAFRAERQDGAIAAAVSFAYAAAGQATDIYIARNRPGAPPDHRQPAELSDPAPNGFGYAVADRSTAARALLGRPPSSQVLSLKQINFGRQLVGQF